MPRHKTLIKDLEKIPTNRFIYSYTNWDTCVLKSYKIILLIGFSNLETTLEFYNNNKRYKNECHGYLTFYHFVNAINNYFNDSFIYF